MGLLLYFFYKKKLHSSINFWLVLLAVKCGEIWVGYYCHCAATLGRLATLVEGMTTMTLKLIKNRLKLLEAPAISPLASRENWQWKETSIILQPTLVSREQNEGLCIRFFLWCDTAHLTNFGASRGGIHTTKGLETATDQHGNCIIWLYYMYIFLWEIPLALCIYIYQCHLYYWLQWNINMWDP